MVIFMALKLQKKMFKDTLKKMNTKLEDVVQYTLDIHGKSIVMKRFRPRAKGRASPIKKPYSNVTIILSDKPRKAEEHGAKS